MTFGEKLQALRKHHEMSQEALAEKLDTSRATISRWETGQGLPDIQQVHILSDLLGVSIDYLITTGSMIQVILRTFKLSA